jgi:hypothetical protein
MEPIGRRVRVLAAVLGVLVLLAGGARGQSSWVDRGCQFRRWSVEDGLPQVTVTALAQTPDGYLWIATFGGLCRFDGVSFDTFDFLNSPLPSNRVTGLFAGRDGVLWIGTEEGWLARYRAGRFETIGQLDSGVLHRFVQTPDGRLFVSSYRHWYQADTGGGPTLVETPWPTEGSPQSSPLDSAGRAWISGGSVVVRDRRGREAPVESDTPWGDPVSVSTDADGTLAVASDKGVFLGRWDTEPARVRRVDERAAHRVLVSDLGVLAARGAHHLASVIVRRAAGGAGLVGPRGRLAGRKLADRCRRDGVAGDRRRWAARAARLGVPTARAPRATVGSVRDRALPRARAAGAARGVVHGGRGAPRVARTLRDQGRVAEE